MRILLLTTKYSLQSNSPYLTDELSRALWKAGHDVEVMCVDWAGIETKARRMEVEPGLVVNIIPTVRLSHGPRRWRQAAKWLFSPIRAAWTAMRVDQQFRADVFVTFSPLTALALPVWLLTRARNRRRFMVQWDFFPDSHFQDGVLQGRLKQRVLRSLESALMRRFSAIGCMSPRNVQYLLTHCDLRQAAQDVHLPLWSSLPSYDARPRDEVRRKFGLPDSRCVFVFGGQLISGRGIEEILEAAELTHRRGVNFSLLFIGRGPRAADIAEQRARTSADIRVLDHVPRSDYLQLLSACDVGLVTTLKVRVPTFPSKTMDYLQTGTTILASVDSSTDYGDFVEQAGLGIQVPAGSPKALAAAMQSLCERFPDTDADRAARLEHYRRIVQRCFSTTAAAQIVLGERQAPDWVPLPKDDRWA
jgi:glycosyltransferase involved in cell wall biosynthesis